MRRWTTLVVAAALATGAYLAGAASRPVTRPQAGPATPQPAAQQAEVVRTYREVVLAAMKDAAHPRPEDEMRRFLAQLETQARAKGEVTALEVEPGVRAIEAANGDEREVQAFTQRMGALQAELGGQPAHHPVTLDEVQQVRRRVDQARDEPARQVAIKELLAAVNGLPASAQDEILRDLDRAVAPRPAHIVTSPETPSAPY